MPKFHYPPTKTVDQVDDYHGALVSDPYRWLEDVDSPETLEWIAAQNALTRAFLDGVEAREDIRRRLTELWDFPKAAAPLERGGRYFQLRNTGLQNQDVLYVMDTPRDEGRVLLDPNALSPDGTVALADWSVSQDGRYLAYATSASGSDWMTWRVREIASGQDLEDRLEWSKFARVAWLPDSSAFYYGRYDPPQEGQAYEGVNVNQKIFLHRLGTSQEEDLLVYQRPDHKEWLFEPIISDDGAYLILHIWEGTDTRNRLFYRGLHDEGDFVTLIPELEAAYEFIGNDGSLFYLRTDLEAPRGRIIAIDLQDPARERWKTLVPQADDALEAARMVHHEFVALYLHDASHRLKRFSREGAFLGEIPLPGMGSIVSINSLLQLYGERSDDELFFTYHSFTHPPSACRYDFGQGSLEILSTPAIRFDFSPYETRQMFVAGKDGTRVPMFLVHRKDMVKDGRNPTLLYGYGGFNVSVTPGFMASRLVWLEMGGVLAVANLRGGGEYGEEWHRAGSLLNKQNVFDDMIACAEYLIEEGLTSPRRLAIEGRSNGGLLVGACITQRPELFGAALPAVGVMDMLRFHLFTVGWAWVSDYGSSRDAGQFRALYAYSPLHNVRPGASYPATLITTADHDDRVVPGHSFKFAAAMQAAQAGEAPILIRIQTKAGHGFGKPTAILIEEQADIWAFLVRTLGMDSRRAP